VSWRHAFEHGRIVLAAALLLCAGLAANTRPFLADRSSRTTRGHDTDVITREAERYESLRLWLPAQGTIGYLQPDDWPTAGAQQRFYLAEYELTPRVVVMSTAPEFVVVVPEASVAGGEDRGTGSRDARLVDHVLYQRFDNGLRIFRRFR
jgi:hypothetical protein